ncbi:MAG TPA: SLC45 family MFS transporter [Chloroflexi bacterium]|jgi:MFS family permease|nr:SLC45 family MFS transporter [Chloroflexota bacterium]
MDIQRWYHLLTINVFWFGVSFMWNALHPIVLPMLLLSFIGEKAKNTHYGMITFAGLVVALLVQPLSGAMSDFTRHRLGRRRPWIIAGSLLNIVWLIGLIVARNYWVIAGSYILLQFTSNLGHGPAQGIIPDIVPREQRGIAAGAKGLMEMMGTIAAAVLAGRIVGAAFAQPGGMIGIIIAVILVVLAITWRGVKETPLQDDAAPTRFTMEWARAVLRIDIRNNRAYARLLLVRFCVLLGTYSVQSFGFYYFSDVHQVESPARVVGNLMTAIAISILVAAYPAGVLSQRWGRKKLSIMALILVGTGMSLLAFTGNMAGLWILGCIIGIGMGVFSCVNWAWATDLVPAAEAGKYLGFSNLATAGSAAASRLMGPIIDLLNAWMPNSGYSALFVIATVGALIGLILTMGIPETAAPSDSIQVQPSQQINPRHAEG